jgi:hypothetical protein|uniref:MqsA n=1 Tax=Caudovirales sp. ctCiv1 TaxID=2826769 RepID=A0A8S5M891_9CAUD|nr:hypothetical protein [uncultured Lachnoclostridium sp.]DAD78569.1 MAG TPA: MqsA [Caudovirales sp. ctCiv1]
MSDYPIKECPHCGNDEFFVKQKVSGNIEFNYKFDGSRDAYNGEYVDSLNYTTISKYAYCNNCRKRLFKITDDMKV